MEDVVLLNNKTGWMVKIKSYTGEVEFVEDPTMTQLAMETQEDHGES